MPNMPMMSPATWLIVSMCRGRKRRRKRLMTKASRVHHATAPPKNPAMTNSERMKPPKVWSAMSPPEILNTAKKARM